MKIMRENHRNGRFNVIAICRYSNIHMFRHGYRYLTGSIYIELSVHEFYSYNGNKTDGTKVFERWIIKLLTNKFVQDNNTARNKNTPVYFRAVAVSKRGREKTRQREL